MLDRNARRSFAFSFSLAFFANMCTHIWLCFYSVSSLCTTKYNCKNERRKDWNETKRKLPLSEEKSDWSGKKEVKNKKNGRRWRDVMRGDEKRRRQRQRCDVFVSFVHSSRSHSFGMCKSSIKRGLEATTKKKEKKRREKKKKTNEEQKQSAKEHAQNEMRNLATSQKSAFSSFYSFSVPSFDSYISRSENDETLYAFAKSITKSSHLCVAFVKTIRERQRRNCRHCYCYYFFAVLMCRCHRRRFHITKRTERKMLALYVCNCVCVFYCIFFSVFIFAIVSVYRQTAEMNSKTMRYDDSTTCDFREFRIKM